MDRLADWVGVGGCLKIQSGYLLVRILYVVYWGACEPLGQSLVVPAIRELAKRGVRMTLVTFEKPPDFSDANSIAKVREVLSPLGVEWFPLRYHKWPKALAKSQDFLQVCIKGLLAGLDGRFDIVHARTFIGGIMGRVLAALLGAKLVYHNEGFYPDEQVDGGVWRKGSLAHRVAKSFEQRMYAAANGVIAMSYRGRKVIDRLPAVRRKATPTIVVPSCVDLERFRFRGNARLRDGSETRLIYIGSIGHRYIFDRICQFVAAASESLGKVRFRVLSGTSHDAVAAAIRAAGVPEGSWSLDSVPHSAVPAELAAHDAGLFFLTQGLSEHGCSPTKIGEYWATGLPVVTTPNVSDTDDIIRRYRVGVIVREHSQAAYQQAALELRTLLQDPGLPRRCRLAAESHYALDAACDRQVELYRAVLSQRVSCVSCQSAASQSAFAVQGL